MSAVDTLAHSERVLLSAILRSPFSQIQPLSCIFAVCSITNEWPRHFCKTCYNIFIMVLELFYSFTYLSTSKRLNTESADFGKLNHFISSTINNHFL